MKESEAKRGYDQLKSSNYQIIIVDTQPGYFYDVITESIDRAIVVTNPDMPSYMSAIRLSESFSRKKVPSTLLVNRVSGRRYEVTLKEMKETYDGEISGVLPEDEIVPISIASKIPACILGPKNRFSKAVFKLAGDLALTAGLISYGDAVYQKPKRKGLGIWRKG